MNSASHYRGCFGVTRPLSLAALDAAISATIERPVRRDRLARDDRVYRWICRRAIAEGTFTFNTTYAEAAKGAGYEVPRLTSRENRKQARHMRVSTVYRALSSLRAAGLVQFAGTKRQNGQWRCLRVRLLPAGRGRPPAGRARRGAHRDRGRIFFSRRSGTSPTVEPQFKPQKSEPTRAREGPGPPGTAPRSRVREFEASPPDPGEASRPNQGVARAAVQESLGLEHAQTRYYPFDLRDQELVEVCEAFEAAYGRSARFSFRTHGDWLRRILARFNRFTLGSTHTAGRAGVSEATNIVRELAKEEAEGLRSAPHPYSVAYFLPLLDEISKGRRRMWKARERRKEQ